MKEEILRLRTENKTYKEIMNILNCSKSIISYYCKDFNLKENKIKKQKLTKEDIISLQDYYKTHTLKECSVKFEISISTVQRNVNNKRKFILDKNKDYIRVKNNRKILKEKCVEYKGGCCTVCGYKKCITALEFHHLDSSQKDFGISSYKYFSWEKIKIELDKCILVCANCHREIHEEIFLQKVH